MNYNYLIVGSGLYGATIAQQAKKAGKSVLVIDKRPNVGGNIYTEKVEGINVHKYGAHIFHTNNKEVWDYVTSFVDFNRFTNSPVANYKGSPVISFFCSSILAAASSGVTTPHILLNVYMLNGME